MIQTLTTARIKVPGGNIWVGTTGEGGGIPLIVLHGGPGSPHDYLEILAELGSGRKVVFYDQLGCGRSDRSEDSGLWRIDRFVEELDTVVRSVACGPVHLLGHSWGTMLAMDYFLAQHNRVASMILDSPCLSMRRVRQDMARLVRELPDAVRTVLEQCEKEGATDSPIYGAAAMAFYRRHVCRKAQWPEPLLRSQAGWGWNVYRTMWGPAEFCPIGNLRDYERETALQSIRVPSLYLCGRHDEITPESTAAYHFATPGSAMLVFEESAHVQHLEEPRRFLEAVAGFLDRVDLMHGVNRPDRPSDRSYVLA